MRLPHPIRLFWLLAATLLVSACSHAPQTPPPAVRLAISQTDRGVLIWLPDNVLFEFGKSSLSSEADAYLDRVVALVKDKTDHELLLEGHTDNVGSAPFNKKLSEQRANTVADALKLRMLPAERMKIAGLGMSKPLAPNDTEVGRKINRRVEIIVLDETVEHLTKGEPANAFEDAFAKLRAALEPELGRAANPALVPAAGRETRQ